MSHFLTVLNQLFQLCYIAFLLLKEFLGGFSGISLLGSEYNDPIINEKGETKTNNSGGINGGITNGNDLIINVFMRPASSISVPQEVYSLKLKVRNIRN